MGLEAVCESSSQQNKAANKQERLEILPRAIKSSGFGNSSGILNNPLWLEGPEFLVC